MAFRAAAMRVGAGGAGAAVAGPAASHCYSRPTARPGSGQRAEEGWVLPQFLDSSQILFSDEEVHDTVNAFLGLPEGSKPGPTVVTEVGGSDDDSSVSSGANYRMEEADNTVACNDMRTDFSRTLQGLLKNSEVQRACMNALRDDPAFSDMLARLPESGALPGRPMEVHNLLPPSCQIAEVGDVAFERTHDAEDPFKDFLDGLADRAKGVGEQIKRKWDSVGNSIGQALIRFGLTIHNILGRPFQQQPQYPEQSEWAADQEQVQPSWFQNPDAVGKVVIKVACCIVALMVFRRVVRF